MQEHTSLTELNGDNDFTNNQLNILRVVSGEIGKDVSKLGDSVETLKFIVKNEGELNRKAIGDTRKTLEDLLTTKTESIEKRLDIINDRFKDKDENRDIKIEATKSTLEEKIEATKSDLSAEIHKAINRQTCLMIAAFSALFIGAIGAIWFISNQSLDARLDALRQLTQIQIQLQQTQK